MNLGTLNAPKIDKNIANCVLNGVKLVADKTINEINRLMNIRIDHNEELFTYSLEGDAVEVPANSTAFGYILIEDMVNFICTNWSARAWEDGDPTNEGLPFTVTVKNMANDRYWNQSKPAVVPVHHTFIGRGGRPTWFPQPMILTRNTRLRFEITNVDANDDALVRINLHGYRIFTYSTANWGVRRR